jgi:hypothetical protein
MFDIKLYTTWISYGFLWFLPFFWHVSHTSSSQVPETLEMRCQDGRSFDGFDGGDAFHLVHCGAALERVEEGTHT